MAGKPLNRLDLRRQREAAEPQGRPPRAEGRLAPAGADLPHLSDRRAERHLDRLFRRFLRQGPDADAALRGALGFVRTALRSLLSRNAWPFFVNLRREPAGAEVCGEVRAVEHRAPFGVARESLGGIDRARLGHPAPGLAQRLCFAAHLSRRLGEQLHIMLLIKRSGAVIASGRL